MKEIVADIWEIDEAVWRVIPTNGTVKANGAGIMGKGVALQALERYPSLDIALGRLIKAVGTSVGVLSLEQRLIAFPVKYQWYQPAKLELIACSCRELIELADAYKMHTVVLPRVGCGNGQLLYSDVRPILLEMLDNRFVAVTNLRYLAPNYLPAYNGRITALEETK